MEKKMLVPQYVHKFSCIGSDCEDTCCAGWRIDIDVETYKKYKSLKANHPLKSLLNKSLSRNRSNATPRNYAKMKLKEDGGCSLLDEQNLCSIQKQLGEDYLSYTCKVYPRFVSMVDDRVEMSVSMSCPEAARLALLNNDLMSFDEVEDTNNVTGLALKQVNTHNRDESHINFYFWDLRVFSISLLQNRNLPISERMIILGMFYKNVQELIDNSKISEIPNLIEETKVKIESNTYKSGLSKLPIATDVQIKLAKLVLDNKGGITNKRFLEILSNFTDGLKQGGEDIQNIEDVVERYEFCYKTYYFPFVNNADYIFENYLVNHVFKNLFPLDQGLDIIKSYVLLTIHYSVIKLLLIGVSGYYEKLDEEIVIKVIQSYSRVVEHHQAFLDELLKYLEKNDFINMAYMAILIKN